MIESAKSKVAPTSTIQLFAACAIGFLIAILATSLLIAIDPQTSFVPHILIYGGSFLVAAFFVGRFVRGRAAAIGGQLYLGMAIGVTVHALAYEGFGLGSRNLFPFEIALFAICGLLPSVVGL
jgi:hypothetical protein